MPSKTLLFALALTAGCSDTSPYIPPDAGYPVAGQYEESGQKIVDGAYHWSVLEAPRFGQTVNHIIAGGQGDAWFLGNSIRHWDGQTVKSYPLNVAVDAGVPTEHVATSAAVVAPSDVWVAGTGLWHFDGTTWTDLSAQVPGYKLFPYLPDRFEVAGDATAVYVYRAGYELGQDSGFSRWNGKGFDSFPVMPVSTFTGTVCNTYGPGLTRSSLFVDKGRLGAVGCGITDPMTGALTTGLGTMTPYVWARSGQQFYGFGAGGASLDTGFPVLTAVSPGDFAQAGQVPRSAIPGINGMTPIAVGPDTLMDQMDIYVGTRLQVGGIAADASGATYAVRSANGNGETTFFVSYSGGAANILDDRLFGWDPYGIALVDGKLLLGSSSGAVLLGVKR